MLSVPFPFSLVRVLPQYLSAWVRNGIQSLPVPALGWLPQLQDPCCTRPRGQQKAGVQENRRTKCGALGSWRDFGRCCCPAPRWWELRTKRAVENSRPSPPPGAHTEPLHPSPLQSQNSSPSESWKQPCPGKVPEQGVPGTRRLWSGVKWVWGPHEEWEWVSSKGPPGAGGEGVSRGVRANEARPRAGSGREGEETESI